jgi:hypothetical protein
MANCSFIGEFRSAGRILEDSTSEGEATWREKELNTCPGVSLQKRMEDCDEYNSNDGVIQGGYA